MSDQQGELATFAGRLGRLFRQVQKDEIRGDGTIARRPYSNEEVAAAIRQHEPAARVSANYLSALRTGTKGNPSMPVLTALARFFQVPVDYLVGVQTPEEAQAASEFARLRAHPKVHALAMRALELRPHTVTAVAKLVDALIEEHEAGQTDDRSPGGANTLYP